MVTKKLPVVRDNRWYGYVPDLPDYRDHVFKLTAKRLPASVDLRRYAPPVMDQGELGSCTAHGITGALRTMIRAIGGSDFPMARLQLYYDERKIEGTVSQDAGAMIRDGIKCVSKIGVAHETLWPYNIKKFKSKPSAKVYNNARQEGALTYERVDVNATALKHALADGYPVIIGISVYESFEDDDVAKSGIVPLPSKGEQMIGGHCMYVVGYGQKKGYFTVRNSWADDWGDAGDCYIPEKYLGNQNLGADYWIIKSVGTLAS